MSYDKVDNERIKAFNSLIQPLTLREAVQLRNTLEYKNNGNFDKISDVNVKNELIESLVKNEYEGEDIKYILLEVRASIIPEESFGWLKNNVRAQIFTLYLLESNSTYRSKSDVYSNTDFMEKIYSYIDFLEYKEGDQKILFDQKANLLLDIKSYWDAICNSETYTKWLKPNSNEQIEWTKRYLVDEMRIRNRRVLTRVLNDDFSNTHTREIILAFIDLLYTDLDEIESVYRYRYRVSAEKTLAIDKMRRAWSQQKYRDAGKTKSPYHFSLNKRTQERLKRMATIQGTTSTAILDMLINSSYEANYMDEHGKDIY